MGLCFCVALSKVALKQWRIRMFCSVEKWLAKCFAEGFEMAKGDATHRKRTARALRQFVAMRAFSNQLNEGGSCREEYGLALRGVLAVVC